ncbi:hypothetical protein [Formosa algae]|uniref:hypothetical protein n=1 Tax=Formosa algae TaxID=225843 RepID=UPI001559E876|nr:hypothetical protein [Formosa algae]
MMQFLRANIPQLFINIELLLTYKANHASMSKLIEAAQTVFDILFHFSVFQRTTQLNPI